MTAKVRLLDATQLRELRVAEPRSRVESRWFYAKKAVPLFPGVDRAIAPSFLQPYYRRWESQLSAQRKLFNRIAARAFRRWAANRARQVAERYGLDEGWTRQATQWAHRRFIDPREIAMFHIAREEQFDTVLRSFEWARMHKIICPQYWTPHCRVAHKIDFYLDAMRLDLPIPALRAVIEQGEVRVLSPAQGDRLVCKPEDGQAGRAIFILTVPEDVRGNPQALGAMLAADRRLQKGGWVVQDHVTVHEALAPLAMKALPTIRLTTMPDETGAPEIVVTYLRFASDPRSEVDNFAAGGLMGLIDPASGMLGEACIKRDLTIYRQHPVSGAQIDGVRIPFWQETCDLVRRAHAGGFEDYRMIGWDIAITQAGPVIIEANARPCPQGAQQVNRRGAGEMRLGKLIAWHLEDAATT